MTYACHLGLMIYSQRHLLDGTLWNLTKICVHVIIVTFVDTTLNGWDYLSGSCEVRAEHKLGKVIIILTLLSLILMKKITIADQLLRFLVNFVLVIQLYFLINLSIVYYLMRLLDIIAVKLLVWKKFTGYGDDRWRNLESDVREIYLIIIFVHYYRFYLLILAGLLKACLWLLW